MPNTFNLDRKPGLWTRAGESCCHYSLARAAIPQRAIDTAIAPPHLIFICNHHLKSVNLHSYLNHLSSQSSS
ncbi:hypothetical protein QUB63_27950 [Microcoleus sp. ARI1-B5]|uniref:hypothetical protein n=1 Tax=unclassified Microcoleus TaxID=2642155 RepID=UPI002FD27D27